ncbi:MULTISPECIES: bifunctional riboflavin kinase/FAD synthetase [Thermoanaerobacter]|uniref:Riboflavin biosynthesis protein n=2 Tax=Thermoanaerobacter TaxID=1754 RepID=B0K9P6_THEP3|nr:MULTISPECIES: bifunctional riboflavin kinase/FAD synthetase [Thermoanaerobacter]ABY94859.1 riboflavin biosynthesis protein RibF [Thermoanaerobacter pseudethanolicus ATCC 33223]ADV79808.1 riboflavin biosynthesis protein RibF [Thermoanaerobacter brockii subsp. finnii Ako-1]HBW59221.1 bifunctional riboflavin kinase/FAD synthetase [Thermoanaerobacter sp.]
MQIVYESNASKYKEAKVIALGNFDGVHIGHQELIKQAIALSKENNLASAVFTFKQHTSKILTPDKQPELITTYQKKVEILKQFNLDYGIFFDFTESFSKLTAEEFIKKILVELLNIKIAVVGHNYRFGYKALGNVDTLKKYSKIYSYKVYVVPPVIREGIVVSSSYIRELIKSGKVEEANSLLGRFFSLQGKVIHGQEIGRKLGFPTANLQISEDLVLPKAGVYVTRVKIEDKFYIAVTNVGSKPTFGGKSISVESYILDYNENLYDKYLEVEFITRIRDEIKFQNLEALKEQVFKDINYAKNFKNILQQKHYVIK